MSDRDRSFRIEVKPVERYNEGNPSAQPTGWSWLTIADVNGVIAHSTCVRDRDVNSEVAVGVERAVRLEEVIRGVAS